MSKLGEEPNQNDKYMFVCFFILDALLREKINANWTKYVPFDFLIANEKKYSRMEVINKQYYRL